MIILTSLPLRLLHFSIIWNPQTKAKYFHFRNFWLADKNYSYSWRECLLKKIKTIIWYFYSCFIPLKWKFSTISLIYGFKKATRKLNWSQFKMVLCDHHSIQVLYARVFIPATEKVIRTRPYRIYRQKTGNCFWSVNYTRSKIPFLCSGNKLQIFKYPPFERTLCIDTYRINFVYQKMELQGNIVYLWKKKIIMILEHL